MSTTPYDEDAFGPPDFPVDEQIIVDNIKPAQLSTLKHRPDPSSLGVLDRLPLEILYQVLHLLDLWSLFCLSRTSRQGRVIESLLPPYRDLIKYVPDTLMVLRKSNLLRYYSADRLYAVLRSKACVSCGEFGTFLFLPTGERCCHICVAENQSFWVVSLSTARGVYGLTMRDLNKLPMMKAIPGTYKHQEVKEYQRPMLVPVKGAARLAENNGTMPDLHPVFVMCGGVYHGPDNELDEHGQQESIEGRPVTLEEWPSDIYGIPSEQGPIINRSVWNESSRPANGFSQWLPSPPLLPEEDGFELDGEPIPDREGEIRNEFCGMASIRFPYLLPDDTLELGLMCKRCKASNPYLMLKSELPAHAIECYHWRQSLSTRD
ncbi:hypothetical protein H109_03849, partial [Trichophyton interdigitale MR816]